MLNVNISVLWWWVSSGSGSGSCGCFCEHLQGESILGVLQVTAGFDLCELQKVTMQAQKKCLPIIGAEIHVPVVAEA